MQAPTKELPEKVIEQPTSKTSIYKQGELIYDGATGLTVGGAASADGSAAPLGQGMNQLLSWGIQNSDPEELKRRAEAGETRTLTPLDKEMLEVLLGQPTVAQMRSCLAKLEPEALLQEGGEEAGLLALEELEFHCEDLDNANDLVKINVYLTSRDHLGEYRIARDQALGEIQPASTLVIVQHEDQTGGPG